MYFNSKFLPLNTASLCLFLTGSPWALPGLVLRLPPSKCTSAAIACCGVVDSSGSPMTTRESTSGPWCSAKLRMLTGCKIIPRGLVKSSSLEHPMSLGDNRLSLLALEMSWSGVRTRHTFLIRWSSCLRLSVLAQILKE